MKPKKIYAQLSLSMTMDWYNAFATNKSGVSDFTTIQIKTFLNE